MLLLWWFSFSKKGLQWQIIAFKPHRVATTLKWMMVVNSSFLYDIIISFHLVTAKADSNLTIFVWPWILIKGPDITDSHMNTGLIILHEFTWNNMPFVTNYHNTGFFKYCNHRTANIFLHSGKSLCFFCLVFFADAW